VDQFERFWNYTLKYLSYRPRSIKETIDALRRKGSPDDITEQIVQKLSEQGFLDDEKFAIWWLDQRTTFKPKGQRLIKAELQQKGISKEIIEQIVGSLSSSSSQTATAVQLLNKRVHRYKNIPLKEMREKMFNFLIHNGFDFDIAKSAIDEVLGKGV